MVLLGVVAQGFQQGLGLQIIAAGDVAAHFCQVTITFQSVKFLAFRGRFCEPTVDYRLIAGIKSNAAIEGPNVRQQMSGALFAHLLLKGF